MTPRLSGACLAMALAAGCSKSSDGDTPPAAPSATAPPASASASPVASAPKPVPTNVAWTGTYVSAPGSLYVYDGGEWKGVHFRGDDAAVALGEGPLSLSIDTKTSVVRGAASGPLGDAVITGAVTKDEVTFSVLRKDPRDQGLTGTGSGRVNGDALEGTIRLSRSDAHVIREAKFKLAKVPP